MFAAVWDFMKWAHFYTTRTLAQHTHTHTAVYFLHSTQSVDRSCDTQQTHSDWFTCHTLLCLHLCSPLSCTVIIPMVSFSFFSTLSGKQAVMQHLFESDTKVRIDLCSHKPGAVVGGVYWPRNHSEKLRSHTCNEACCHLENFFLSLHLVLV